MSKIRKLYYFDKKNTQEMISFLNNNMNDAYINHVMFNPFIPLHHLLPLAYKFLPESFVLKYGGEVRGLVTVAPIKCKNKKMEIQKLFFEENAYDDAAELVQYVVSKYKAMGATSIIVKVDDYLPELLTMLVSKCGFTQISYEKLWRVNKFINVDYSDKKYRSFRNSDAKALANIYNDNLLPHFRPLLNREPAEFKESLFRGLSYLTEYKYTIEDKRTKNVIGGLCIQTSDDENYLLDFMQSSWEGFDINEIISFAISQIQKRKSRFALFVRSQRYNISGEKYEEMFIKNGFERVQNQIVLTNSSARVLKETARTGKYTVLSNFCPSNAISTKIGIIN